MGDATDPREGEVEITPEERRFLERFFRRQALPWALLLAVISVAGAVVPTVRGALHARPDAGQALEVRTSAALAQLRGENEKLRQRVDALEQGLARRSEGVASADLGRRLDDAQLGLRQLEERVAGTLERRLDALETRIGDEGVPPPRAGAQGSDDVAAWDASAILDRIYALERRQEEDSAARLGEARGGAAALSGLEQRVSRLEQMVQSLPAAPAPR
jgi:BMFP domain-containing protein YqiC